MDASIVIASYNSEKYIARAIRSCLEQTCDVEVIVVDDGSTDDTKKILTSFGNWIRVEILTHNQGLARARNIGIRKARSKFVVCVDADDFINAELCRVESLYLNLNKFADAVACDYYLVDDEENVFDRKDSGVDPIDCGVMYRKDKLIDIGLYDDRLDFNADKDLRDRFLNHFRMDHIQFPLYKYRRHTDNRTIISEGLLAHSGNRA